MRTPKFRITFVKTQNVSSRFLVRLILVTALSVSVKAQKCAPGETVTSTIKQDLVTWTDCTNDKNYRQEFTNPIRARVFPFKMNIFSQSFSDYPQDLTKVDIFWFDETVTIDYPLNSFGGDILIYADVVNINAPIDSRVYIEEDVDHFSPATPNYYILDRGTFGKVPLDTTKTSNAIINRPDYIAAFRDYYLHCNDCTLGGTRMPEMPAGLASDTPMGIGFPNMTKPGGNAPGFTVIDRNATRSGNIYIYARVINIKPELRQPQIPVYRFPAYSGFPPFPECAGPESGCDTCVRLPWQPVPRKPASGTAARDALIPYAINAGGLRGGRGGPGWESGNSRQ